MLNRHVPGFLTSLRNDIKEASKRSRSLPVLEESLPLEAAEQESPPAHTPVTP